MKLLRGTFFCLLFSALDRKCPRCGFVALGKYRVDRFVCSSWGFWKSKIIGGI